MILSDIKNYMMTNKRVTLGDLALHFDTDLDAMRGMLDQWIRKGKLLKTDLKASCRKTCGKCADPAAMEVYEWTQ